MKVVNKRLLVTQGGATIVRGRIYEQTQLGDHKTRLTVKNVMDDLAANGWDVEKCAPWPSSTGVKFGDPDYNRLKSKHTLYRSLTQAVNPSYIPGAPDIVKADPERQRLFIKKARRNAAHQYESFICKLEDKIGSHSAAELDGSHVWGYSILTVTTPEGTQRWKTQTIINVSKLGKLFNQYPTRKVK
ncbi:hypothetical protein HQ81_0151 [Dickeya phage phiDP23.1]|uniref:Uncharacterized protein n=15 Tax=Aglimvirinae TaxID=2169530 RepID=I0J350_9CAUD|nr:hypothetical protein G379_gp053 [Dickeya phage vB-DsoM-LIMEstone1]YP_009102978.1 hypothetical protein DA66_0139 [Dickeya phage RC-2014]AIM51391.1 hypothetical protein HQ80_0172 [Dickeya phage phiD3]AIM51685.1 hypothetical protein HQ82_0025 [Dickeya phage phiDP10.3]AIM51971.1 hypothetical protein HQ81_0151 [Dickeya phage phiDP23.1]ASD51361.1 hypothetical protein [Dickeya phage JA15]ASD51556.1 hypothetical protein [Dickeya phage XF4]ATW62177.1 hypothetical protein [Dickeya phage PP35]AYN55